MSPIFAGSRRKEQSALSFRAVQAHKKAREWRAFGTACWSGRPAKRRSAYCAAEAGAAAAAAAAAAFLALAFALCLALAFAFALCLALAFTETAFSAGAAAGALVWAAAGVETTAKGMARTAALARMDRIFFMRSSGVLKSTYAHAAGSFTGVVGDRRHVRNSLTTGLASWLTEYFTVGEIFLPSGDVQGNALLAAKHMARCDCIYFAPNSSPNSWARRLAAWIA